MDGAELKAAKLGEEMGWLHYDDGAWSYIDERPLQPAYLPLSLVGDEKGQPTGQSSLTDRIRRARDVLVSRLLVDLYEAQDLAEFGGIDRELLRKQFERAPKFATGDLQVFHFDKPRQWMSWKDGTWPHLSKGTQSGEDGAAKDFFARVRILADAGALEWPIILPKMTRRLRFWSIRWPWSGMGRSSLPSLRRR
ncbi:hypothetical protein [Altericroceibacterium xinjiangense]|uniref:hypothetical protein n=1 Tax=Altericroceibacterium xinjiangense TaxID=762261 RepID=UPI000F7ED8B3|nr:hypothetical protein [Altericroceibacterium xinjiangense]